MTDHFDHTEQIVDLKIVVVDDNRNFLKLVRSVLRNFGVKDCIVFDDPVEALTYLEIHDADCVITDLVMPKMNGFQLAHRIRNSPLVPNRLLPLIMVTGHANRGNVAKAIQSGIDEVMVKPFRPADMQRRLISIASNSNRYIKTPAGYVNVGRSDAINSQMLDRSAAKSGRVLQTRFKRKPDPQGEAPPAAAPTRRDAVAASDVFKVKRSPRSGRQAPRDDAGKWEI